MLGLKYLNYVWNNSLRVYMLNHNSGNIFHELEVHTVSLQRLLCDLSQLPKNQVLLKFEGCHTHY